MTLTGQKVQNCATNPYFTTVSLHATNNVASVGQRLETTLQNMLHV